ncbi:hypothetical protein BsWGS_27017 [Bradybaena similaris]
MTGFLSNQLTRACILTLLLTLVQHAGRAEGAPDKICDPLNPKPARGTCGQQLADLIAMICAALQSQNRNEPTGQVVTRPSLMLDRRDALSYLAKRQTTGYIVCECCIHACDYNELLQYCNLPPRLLRLAAGK